MTDFHRNNREKLLKNMEEGSIILAFAGKAPHRSRDAYYPFEVNKNFFYLTGVDRENIIYMGVKHSDSTEEFLFIEKSDPVLEKWVGKKLTKEDATKITGISNVAYINDLKSKINNLLQSTGRSIDKIYLDMFVNSYDDSPSPGIAHANKFKEKYPHVTIRDFSKSIAAQRFIKSDSEIENMKKAIDITNETFKLLLSKSSSCSYEHQLEAYLDFSFKLHGADHAFDTIAASGKNATILHYVENNAKIPEDSLVMFDFGARWNYYCADISRTFPAKGKFSQRQAAVYNVVLKALKETTKIMKPGALMKDVNEFAKNLLAEGAMELGLIKEKSEIDKYYYHGIGHPLGLDTHDVGDRDMTLQPGMVYTCEPGLYIEEEGIGVRIEDDILITESGNINLSESIIREIEDIENFMNN
ncbi:aminopeptidase P family protein [Alkalibacter mobilis]|uniref:aminopeptidase P family protein n=1 Tax=Alkalibacter mobilis TaxID=2787712 RepID=UPI0018A0490A|nr:aminopeptidase P family protein [Alkalibacter mobilis]MBF7095950.1 aminopeptidase P family protein [Alkalibacter mobilis]